MARLKHTLLKRDKWHFLTTVVGHDRVEVSGIGVQTANRILECRAAGARFKDKEDLKRTGVITRYALPFILVGSSAQKRLDQF